MLGSSLSSSCSRLSPLARPETMASTPDSPYMVSAEPGVSWVVWVGWLTRPLLGTCAMQSSCSCCQREEKMVAGGMGVMASAELGASLLGGYPLQKPPWVCNCCSLLKTMLTLIGCVRINLALMLAAVCAAVASNHRFCWTAVAATSIPALLARYPSCWPSEQRTMSTGAAAPGAPPQQCVCRKRLRRSAIAAAAVAGADEQSRLPCRNGGGNEEMLTEGRARIIKQGNDVFYNEAQVRRWVHLPLLLLPAQLALPCCCCSNTAAALLTDQTPDQHNIPIQQCCCADQVE